MKPLFAHGQLSLKTWRNKLRQARRSHRIRKQMPDIDRSDLSIIEKVRPYTMLSPERLYAFIEATRYITKHNIPGSIVECGVWKGGAVMSSLLTLRDLHVSDREVFLYDTFEGMPAPGQEDQKFDGEKIGEDFAARQLGAGSTWCRGEMDEVRTNILSTAYNPERIHFVKGKVEDTIPDTLPEQIAILRLDTDWYESTRHELQHLFPRLVPGGVLIIDDYGHWAGARQAVDEYFERHNIPILLQRTDYTGRIGIKAA